MSYKQVFHVSIESSANVDYDGIGDQAHAIAPNQPYPYYVAINETRRTIGDKIQTEMSNAFDAKVRSEAANNGINVSSVVFDSLQYRWVETNRYTAYIFPITPITIYSEKYTLDMVITVLSDKPFAASPMPIWVIQIVKLALEAVVLILIAYFAIMALQACFKGLFVKTQTVTVYNPDGSIKETKTTEEPSWTSGILVVGGLIVVALLVVPVLLDRLKGRPKKRAAAKRRTKRTKK